MAQRDFPVGGATLRYSCAAMAILDPEDALPIADLFRSLGRVGFLRRAVLAGLEGHRKKYDPARAPFTVDDAAALVDEAGVRACMDAVSSAALAYLNPDWDAAPPEGPGVPKA